MTDLQKQEIFGWFTTARNLYFLGEKVDKFLEINDQSSSSGQIKEAKLKGFLSRVPIWEFAKISKTQYQNLSKVDQESLLIKCYDSIVTRFQ